MARLLTVIAFLFLLSPMMLAGTLQQAVELPETATVLGRITDWWACPLPGARITVRAGGKEVATATTDAGGNYRLEGLVGWPMTVDARLVGFSTAQRQDTLRLGPNLWDAGLPVDLEGETVISGVIRNEDHTPIVGASVTLHSAFHESPAHQARSGAAGAFSITVYQSGQYVLYATAAGRIGASVVLDTSEPNSLRSISLVLRRSRWCH
jgi:hypothetical protein